MVRLLRRGWLGEGHDSVEGEQALAGDAQGVDLDRLQSRVSCQQVTEGGQDLADRGAVGDRAAAEPVKQGAACELAGQARGLGRRKRGGRDGDVGQRFGHRPAQSG